MTTITGLLLIFLGGNLNAQDEAKSGVEGPAPSNAPTRIVRDPVTGRLFQQKLQSVQVPVVRWETRPQTQTVYEPEVSTRYVAVPQLTYTPVTSQVAYPVTRGLWNPFRTPVQGYEYRTVTQYVPRVQNYSVPVTSQKWVPKKQTVYVPQPVQKTETRQQIVTTELPSSASTRVAVNPAAAQLYAAQPSPRLRIPLLARQSYLSPSTSLPASTASAIDLSSPRASQPSVLANGSAFAAIPPKTTADRLRPVPGPASTDSQAETYRTAARNSFSRDLSQAGMSATVLR